MFGEAKVSRRLYRLNSKKYKVLNDILLRTSWGSSQIDHIVISTFGIFVIETKNYKGWIFGHEKSQYWTQTIYQDKTKFKNPVKQNWGHIFALKEILSEYSYAKYHPIVVFAGDAELKGITSKVPVIYSYQLLRFIKQINETECLSAYEVNEIFKTLLKLNLKDRKSKRKHKRTGGKYCENAQKKGKSLTCPACGAKLTVRNGTYGLFYGCTRFPECRYTRNIPK